MALLGVIVSAPRFYELAQDGSNVTINVRARTVSIEGETFPFELSKIEEKLIQGGGVTEMYKKYGSGLFRAAMAAEKTEVSSCGGGAGSECESNESKAVLAW